MELHSPAFGNRQPIPPKYTCSGKDLSPPLSWSHVPPGTASFAIFFDDPDSPSGTWDHWVIFNIPGTTPGLPEGVPAAPTLRDGSCQGRNGWGKAGYRGPCPPRGRHRYVFHLLALSAMLPLKAGASKQSVIAASRGLVLDHAEYEGTFARA